MALITFSTRTITESGSSWRFNHGSGLALAVTGSTEKPIKLEAEKNPWQAGTYFRHQALNRTEGQLRESCSMPERETEYRGYKIRAKPTGRDWRLAVSPTRPDLQIMRRYSFRVRVASVDDAILHVQRRIDTVLEFGSMLPKR